MILHSAIERANQANRLGLILYTIPAFPNPETFAEVIDILSENNAVSVIESTLPVTSKFSLHANEVIMAAHRIAATFAWQGTLTHFSVGAKPVLYVLYEATVEQHGFPGALNHLGKAAGLILEWEERNHQLLYKQECERVGMELVQCVGPWMAEEAIGTLLALTETSPLVYLMSANQTGGDLFPAGDLARCIQRIRRFRPAAKIAAGFGISTPQHVQNLKAVDGLNAVIVGTAWLQAMTRSVQDAKNWLAELESSL